MDERRVEPLDPPPEWLQDLQHEWSASLIQTHISWLLLTDDTVFKFKRPVRFEFLDYTTRARRLTFCHEEVRLNARFAPSLYRGVETFGADAEPAVVMARFDESGRLDHVCARGELTTEHLQQLVSEVVELHREAAVAPADGPLGTPEAIWSRVAATIDTLQRVRPPGDPLVARVAVWLASEHQRIAPLLARRLRTGQIREGHGDLHLANLVLLDGQVTLFDGIEFSEELRWLDIASELSFPYIDLLEHGNPELTTALVNEWLVERGDAEGVSLLRYYGCYRAVVRAMVSALEGDDAAAERYLRIAVGVAEQTGRPRLLITHGLSGSGKSTRAREVAFGDARATTVWLRSDVERKRLHHLAALASSRSGVAAGIYDEATTAATYDRMAAMAEVLLAAGWSVVVDATFLHAGQRELFRAVAKRTDSPFGILECTAPDQELFRRVQARHGDASEADRAVLEHQLATYIPLQDEELVEVVSPV